MIDEAITKAIGAIETIAPKAWALLVQSQIIEGATSLALCTIGLAAALTWLVIMHRRQWRIDSEEAVIANFLGGMVLAIAALCSVIALPTAIARLAYPEVYAARSLVTSKLVRGEP